MFKNLVLFNLCRLVLIKHVVSVSIFEYLNHSWFQPPTNHLLTPQLLPSLQLLQAEGSGVPMSGITGLK